MAALILPSRRISQPGVAIGPDWANPLTRGLVLLDGAPGVNQSVNFGQADYTLGTANVENVTSKNGRGVAVTAEGNFYLSYGLVGQLAPPYTVVFQYVLNVAPSTAVRMFGNFTASTYGYNLSPNATNGRFLVARDGTNTVLTGGAHKLGVVRTVVGVVTASTVSYYEDGVLVAGPTSHGGVVAAAGDLRIGADSSSSSGARHAAFFAALYSRALADEEAREISRSRGAPWQLFRPIQRRIIVGMGAGGGASQSIAFTLEDVAASFSQTLTHSQSLSGALDGVTVSIAQTAQHSQALAATLDGVTASISQAVAGANNQALAITLDGVTVAASQTLNHPQSFTATLDDVTASFAQTLSHGQALSATLDGITVDISQSAAPSAKDQSLAVTLDDITAEIVQIGALPAVGGMGFEFTDAPSALWWKRKPKALDEEVAEQKVRRVVRVIKEIAARHQPDQPAKQARREVLQAIAPILEDMPGFDWTPLYRSIAASFDRQREEAARVEAVAQIARIRALEQDDEDVMILLMI